MRFYEYESRRIVERAGIPVTEYGFCRSSEEAKEATELGKQKGYPLAFTTEPEQ